MSEEEKAPRTEITEELRVLGQRLREAFVTARESQTAQEFRQELQRGLTEFRAEVAEVAESEDVQRLGKSVREAVQQVGKSDVGQQVRKGVLSALKELNTQIERVIEEAEKTKAEETPPEEPSN